MPEAAPATRQRGRLRDGGAGSFLHVTQRLHALARAEHLDVTSRRTLDEGVTQAVLLGSCLRGVHGLFV